MNALNLVFPLLLALPLEIDPVALADLNAFPPAAIVIEAYQFSEAHNHWITSQRLKAESEGRTDLAAWLYTWEREADCRLGCWGLLTAATNPTFDEMHRLNCLRQLRDAIGRAAYYGGRMPPAVPYRLSG